MSKRKQIEYIGAGILAFGLYFLLAKPIPLCYVSVFGVCIVPNPILVVLLGTNPNYVIGWIGIIAGIGLFVFARSNR